MIRNEIRENRITLVLGYHTLKDLKEKIMGEVVLFKRIIHLSRLT